MGGGGFSKKKFCVKRAIKKYMDIYIYIWIYIYVYIFRIN